MAAISWLFTSPLTDVTEINGGSWTVGVVVDLPSLQAVSGAGRSPGVPALDVRNATAQLAYQINKLGKAHYLCVNIEADQAVMGELEHAFKFNDAVLRHLTVQKKKAETGPSSMMKTVEREEARKSNQAEYAA